MGTNNAKGIYCSARTGYHDFKIKAPGITGIEFDLPTISGGFTGTEMSDLDLDVMSAKFDTGASLPVLATGRIVVDDFSSLALGAGDYFNGELLSRSTNGFERQLNRPQYIANRRVTTTIASDAITMQSSLTQLTPQSGTTDDLATITLPSWVASSVSDGLQITLCTTGTNVITVKHNTGNIYNAGGADVTLNNLGALRYMYRVSDTRWVQIT